MEVFHFLDFFYTQMEQELEGSEGRTVKYMGDTVLMLFPPDNPSGVITHLKKMKQNIESSLDNMCIDTTPQIKVHIGVAACGEVGKAGEKIFDICGVRW